MQVFTLFILVIMNMSNAMADSASKDCDRLARDQSISCRAWTRSECEGVFVANCDDPNGKKIGVLCSVEGLELHPTRLAAKDRGEELCRRLKLTDPKLRLQECQEIKHNFQNAKNGTADQVGTAQEWFSQWTQKCADFGEIETTHVDENTPIKTMNPICSLLDQLAIEGGSNVTQLKSFQDALVKYCPDRVKVDTIIK